MEQVKVVLFCGGHGQRMRSHPGDVPKPLVRIGGRPMLWHVMRYYAHFGFTDFVLCLGYGAGAVRDYFRRHEHGWDVTFVDTGPGTSIGERLMRVRGHVGSAPYFLANYADTLTDADLGAAVDRFRRGTAVASLLAVPPKLTHHAVQMSDCGTVTAVRPISELVRWENGGYFLFRHEIFEALRPGEDLVPHALDRLVRARTLAARRHTGFWRAVDTPRDRAELQEMYARGSCPWMVWDRTRCRQRPGADRWTGGTYEGTGARRSVRHVRGDDPCHLPR